MRNAEETRLKKAHITLMQHPMTALYSQIIASGKNEVVDAKTEGRMFTAYTDGINKVYCKEHIAEYEAESELRGMVLHENLHVALKQIPRHRDLSHDHKMLNYAMDFVVNDVIKNTVGTTGHNKEPLVTLNPHWLYHPMFHNWSVRRVYEYLKKRKQELDEADKNGSQPQPCPQQNNSSTNDEKQPETDIDKALRNMDKGMDDHVFKEVKDMNADELKKLEDAVDKALRQGGMLAGRMGASIPRVIGDLLEVKVDWREVFREFVQSAMRGKDEYTWRKMNKSYLANDMYLPSIHSETMGEVVVAIDTSGSIDNEQISEFASELASICETCNPDKVRVLWWDTKVHGEQVFEGNYNDIAKMLKPQGGGGTHVGCVSEYIIKSSINAEALVIFTDGYVENNPKWEVTTPTMWFVTQNSSFVPPAGGRCVTVEQ
jgi:predicted metal-dependent peptidase